MTVDVMAIGAHPDDVEIAMGGTIAALAKEGKKVVLVDLSNGEPTPFGTPEKRMKEAAKAAKKLGVFKRITLDLPNREIIDSIENRKKLATVIREYSPDILFMPYWHDGHPDHIQTLLISQAARFYAKLSKTDMPFDPFYPRKILQYDCLHIKARTNPSFIFDTTETMKTKVKALKCYKSQFIKNKKNLAVIDNLKKENSFWGLQIKTEYGEPFFCLEYLALKDLNSLLNA